MDQQKNQSIADSVPTIQDKISHTRNSLPSMSESSHDVLKDLLEKNIRWSQVIYEQNKKILRRIFWGNIFTWIKVALTVAVVAIAFLYASSWYRNLQRKYPFVFGAQPPRAATSTSSSAEDFLNVLPINDVQRAQLKQFIK